MKFFCSFFKSQLVFSGLDAPCSLLFSFCWAPAETSRTYTVLIAAYHDTDNIECCRTRLRCLVPVHSWQERVKVKLTWFDWCFTIASDQSEGKCDHINSRSTTPWHRSKLGPNIGYWPFRKPIRVIFKCPNRQQKPCWSIYMIGRKHCIQCELCGFLWGVCFISHDLSLIGTATWHVPSWWTWLQRGKLSF